jgi:uncharacterized membrane protein YfcA
MELGILIATTFFAAFVTGGLGYGFSSITVPVGLLFHSNRILNPSLVLIEIGANIYVLFSNRQNVRRVWKRLLTIICGLVPAVIVGSYLLTMVPAEPIKFVTYSVLAPLILLQSCGFKRPIHTEKGIGVVFGGLLGILYSLTTISGPPLALALNNEGYEKHDFKAAVGIIRTIESVFTGMAYAMLGIFTAQSLELFWWIIPGVVVGMPLGAFVLNKLEQLWFRRLCISIDVWLIAFGFGRALWSIQGLSMYVPITIFVAMAIIDAVNFRRFASQYEITKQTDLFDQQKKQAVAMRKSA